MKEAEKQAILREFLQNDRLADDILSGEVLLSTLLVQMMQRIMHLERFEKSAVLGALQEPEHE
jgi:hypothetical protein